MEGEDLTHDWPDGWILTSNSPLVAVGFGDLRPLFQAAVGRPGPDFGPVGRLFDCSGRVFGPTGLLGRLWGQIGPIRGPFRGRPTLENRAPA